MSIPEWKRRQMEAEEQRKREIEVRFFKRVYMLLDLEY